MLEFIVENESIETVKIQYANKLKELQGRLKNREEGKEEGTPFLMQPRSLPEEEEEEEAAAMEEEAEEEARTARRTTPSRDKSPTPSLQKSPTSDGKTWQASRMPKMH